MSMTHLLDDVVALVKADGQRWDGVRANVQPTTIFIDDGSLPLEEGDVLERALKNGLVERYVVLDRGYHTGMGSIPDHYQAKVRKESALPSRAAGVTYYTVTGPNARINIGARDSSTNVVNLLPGALFDQLATAIALGVNDTREREELDRRLRALEASQNSPRYLDTYQAFIAAAANHMTILAPFLPALAQLLPG